MRIASEEGFSLVELLVAMTLSLVVLGAVLTTFSAYESNARANNQLNDSQDQARVATDRLARQLRLAAPTQQHPVAIDRATSTDLVFQIADPGQRRVRYCLDSTAPLATVWYQVQGWSGAAPPALPSTDCPDSALSSRAVATAVVNGGRGLFTYDSATLADVTQIRTDLYVDVDPARRPEETRLGTQVFLRNQNRDPSPSFTATVGASRRVTLNGSTSFDPEGERLTYVWFNGGTGCPLAADTAPGAGQGTRLGTGITFVWQAPAAGSYSLRLCAYDPASHQGARAETVAVP